MVQPPLGELPATEGAVAQDVILYERRGRIVHIVLNRPHASNAIDESLALELREAGRRVVEDDEAYVAVITGAGDTFSSGAEPLATDSGQGSLELARRRVADGIAAIPQPTIAAINGDALGQGLELALACDVRIAAQGARFALDQVSHGLIPWDGGTQRLPRVVPRGIALEMILTGRKIEAQEALRLGLVNAVVPTEELAQKAQELAEALAQAAPIAGRYAKEAVHLGMDLSLGQGLRLEADLAVLLHTSRDRAEGIAAFLEKRKPEFTGQ